MFLSNRVHPEGSGRRDAAAGARRDDRGVRADRRAAARVPPGCTGRTSARVRRRGTGPPARADRTRRLRADGFAPLKGKRVGLVTNHRPRPTARRRSICSTPRRTSRLSRSSVPSTASAASSMRPSPSERTRRPGSRSIRSMARRGSRPPRCSTGSTRSSSTCRTSARASTPT